MIATGAIPVLLQARAELRARSLCEEVGGLTVRADIPADAVFAATSAAVFSQGDPVTDVARARNLRPAIWPHTSLDLLPCSDSAVCIGILQSQSRQSYLQVARASGDPYLISASGSSQCAPGGEGSRLPAELASIRSYFSRLTGTQVTVCRASPAALRAFYVVPEPTASSSGANLLGAYLQFRAWRVFQRSQPRPVIEYNQFGVQTIWAKIRWLLSQMVGVHDVDPTGNRCGIGFDSPGSGIPRNSNTFFSVDGDYPVGRFQRKGTSS